MLFYSINNYYDKEIALGIGDTVVTKKKTPCNLLSQSLYLHPSTGRQMVTDKSVSM